ncbi:hypothetical protein LTR56_017844 [Elasticomyces elasticus]|nr:hypothetical protein LTR22_025604 [Elasticomyces elasticus]KAK3629831.1 hypothetical protein LTR56_017844 [Elasticomyces elasticus]KAK4917525.1 hypothetical protein LTR49_014611 [Elasticomyces elasticus]KAK5756351.1 hypothetical protein LTS12_013540 [Elasticomyces elasticus]
MSQHRTPKTRNVELVSGLMRATGRPRHVVERALEALEDTWGEEDPTSAPISYGYVGVIPKHRESAARVPECIKYCKICCGQYRSMSAQNSIAPRKYDGHCTDQEASDVIKGHITDITTKLTETQTLLHQHGDTIKKRFEKRTPQKRAELIRAAMPDMYPSKWLEAYYVFDEHKEGDAGSQHRHLAGVSRRKCWLLPYLNIETLSNEPTKLLVLLHLRATHTFEQFLPYDVERTKMAFEDYHVKTIYNPHAVVMCREAGTVGQLTQWDRAGAHRGDIVGFPRAQLAFEAANELATFLRNFIHVTLAIGPCDNPAGSVKLYATVEESLSASSHGRSSYNERAFSRPPTAADFTHFKTNINSMIKSTYDELWLLQTDPMFFRDRMATIEASGYHRGLTGNEKAKNILCSIRQTVARVELAIHVEACLKTALASLDTYLSHEVQRGRPLPQHYDESLGYADTLMYFVAQTGSFDEHFTWSEGRHVCVPGEGDLQAKDVLYWNFGQISFPAEFTAFALDRSFHLHYIEHLLQSPKQRGLVDQALYEHYSHMLAIDEAENVLASYLPRGTGAGRDPEFEESMYPQGIQVHPDYEKLSGVLNEFLRAPVPTAKPTTENLRRLKGMHSAASSFWEGFASIFSELVVTPDRGNREAQINAFRSPGHLVDFEEECARLQAVVDQKELAARVRATTTGRKPPATNIVQKVWGSETPSPNSSPQRKVKFKTRSDTIEESTSQLSDLQLENDEKIPKQECVSVGKDSKTTFMRMFSPGTETKGLLKWDQITAALIDAGLSMVPNGGLRVTFTHSDPQKGSIVFHRPHPDPSVSVIMLRCMAKRLGKWFGWEAGTFV